MNLSAEDLAAITTLLNRTPSVVEQVIFDTMWSEHCSYKSSKSVLKKYLPTQGSDVALGIGEDSGIIRFANHNGKQYCIAVSHESHNHPSQILPIEGAATGVGGVVRDVYCMGANVIGVLNSLHFGTNKDGKYPLVDEIAEKVVKGVSDYSNPLGVPVLGGETLYHPSYNDNCLVNVAALGLINEDNIIRSFVPAAAEHEPYDVILIGKSTDSTGFGGASFSSVTLDSENSTANIGAVQVHDPFLKRVIVEALNALFEIIWEENIEVGFKDLGAGGIACAASEIAVGGGFGVRVNLNDVNVAVDDLPPEVIACSETQERFCMAVPKTFTQRVLDMINIEFEMPTLYYRSGAVKIGEITKEKQFILDYKGQIVCDLPVTAITTEVAADRHQEKRSIHRDDDALPSFSLNQLKSLCDRSLTELNNQSKRHVYRFFDNAVRGDTVIYPGEADAVVIAPIEGCTAGLAVSMDSNLYGHHDPYVSGAAAVAEGVRNVIAVGATPIAVTDCLNYGNPEKRSVFFDFNEGVRGIADACHTLNVVNDEPLPVISGNVSFYNESKLGSAVVPSPVIVVIAKMDDYHNAKTMKVTAPDMALLMLGERRAEFGGTQVESMLEQPFKCAPQVRLDDEAKQNKLIMQLMNEKKIHACHDISMGGMWIALCEMLLGERGVNPIGATITISEKTGLKTLFSENGGYIIAVEKNQKESILTMSDEYGVACTYLGNTEDTNILCIESENDMLTWDLTELNDGREASSV